MVESLCFSVMFRCLFFIPIYPISMKLIAGLTALTKKLPQKVPLPVILVNPRKTNVYVCLANLIPRFHGLNAKIDFFVS